MAVTVERAPAIRRRHGREPVTRWAARRPPAIRRCSDAANSMGADGYALFSSWRAPVGPTGAEIGDFYLTDTARAGAKVQLCQSCGAAIAHRLLATAEPSRAAAAISYKSDAVFSDVGDIRSVYIQGQQPQRPVQLQNSDARGHDRRSLCRGAQWMRAEAIIALGPWDHQQRVLQPGAKRNDSVTYTYQVD